MRHIQKESLQYALLLVVLLAIAAVAVLVTLDFINESVPERMHQVVLNAALWSLTMGFMLIAGAFGIWAVNVAADAESRRRLGSLVDAMDYIQDGVLALDRQGIVTGLNPAAADVFGMSAKRKPFADCCPGINRETLHQLLHSNAPVEVETDFAENGLSRTLRIRSQPSQGIAVLLVSDVTRLVCEREKSRRTAYIQLIGHLANGVANDFNDLLCGIAGHASLLARANLDPSDRTSSSNAIQDCAGRGMQLARQLMQLAVPGSESHTATRETAMHVEAGIGLLRASLPADWHIEAHMLPGIAPVNLPPVQLQHLVLCMGLAAADPSAPERRISISLNPPPSLPDPAGIAAVLTIATGNGDIPMTDATRPMEHAGVILAIIQTLIVQAGGRLECYQSGNTKRMLLALPRANTIPLAPEMPETLSSGLSAYAAGWNVVMDDSAPDAAVAALYFRQAGIQVQTVTGLAPLLASLQDQDRVDAVVIGHAIPGHERASLLKAISKLCPRTGIVLRQETLPDPEHIPGAIPLSGKATPLQLLQAIIEARSLVRSSREAKS